MLNPLCDLCYIHTGAFAVKGQQLLMNDGIRPTAVNVLMGMNCKL